MKPNTAKFKIGDRVRIINPNRVSNGEYGVILSKPTEDTFIGSDWVVNLQKSKDYYYDRTFGYLEHELELDKNQVVLNIVKDLL